MAPLGVSASFSSSFSEARARFPHRVDLLLHLPATLFDALVGDLLVVEDHELANRAFSRVQVVAELDDPLGHERRPRDGLDHGQLAALDPPRDLDLALAREEGDRAHFPEIHAHRVVGLVEGARREIELQLLGAFGGPVDDLVVAQILLVRVDDLDARAAEGVEEVVQLVGRRDLRRQQLVDLVVEEVALLLADVDELPYLVVLLFEGLVAACYVSSSMRWSRSFFRCHKLSISCPC